MLLSIIQLSGDKGSANRAKSKEKKQFSFAFPRCSLPSTKSKVWLSERKTKRIN